MIVAHANRPVRVKFVNELPTGAGGDLFDPVDTTAMGAGDGPAVKTGTRRTPTPYDPTPRTAPVIHLHGGLTPWISDGTRTSGPPGRGHHQVPARACRSTACRICPQSSRSGRHEEGGDSDGTLTFYYTNKQSARLMWYHDHAYGLTRLNVYAGEVSAYRLDPPLATDAQE